MLTKILLCFVLVASILVPGGYYLFSEKKAGNFKAALGFNVLFFFGTLIVSDILLFGGNIQAAEATKEAVNNTEGWRYLAAALSTGLSCVGAGIAVASAASSALGALSEDSSIMGKALIFVALAESIALYGLIISFTILG